MYKELLSTDNVCVNANTDEWCLGIEFDRNLYVDDSEAQLLRVGFLCFHIYIAFKKKRKK